MAKARFRIVQPSLWPYVDWPLILVTLALLACGIITLWGALSRGEGPQLWPIPFYAKRQILYASVGLVGMAVVGFIDYRRLHRWVWLFYAILILALVGLLIKGAAIKGATSWYDLGFFRLQPSEPGKIVLVLTLASYLALRMRHFRGLRHIFIPLGIIGLPLVLILAQRDLGTALVLIPITGAMFWVAGLRKWIFALFILLGIIGAVSAYPHLKPYQQERIKTFLNPEADRQGSGWNIFQAQTALGSGQLLGKGWGRGTQTNFRFLPEFHTDFIFPTVGEQFGFVGCMVVIGLFIVFIGRMVRLAQMSGNVFGVLIITGLTAMLCTHIIQNIGMVVGLLPVTGLPLPFFSYGGSFMLTCLASVGLVLSIAARRPLEEED